MPHGLEAAGFPPAGEVFPLAGQDWPSGRASIPGSWRTAPRSRKTGRAKFAANPALFNGRMVFQRNLSFADGRIEGEAYLAPFATFLHWRRLARPAGGYHLFALPLPISSDGALIAIRMGPAHRQSRTRQLPPGSWTKAM